MASLSSIQQVKARYDLWDAWPKDRLGKRNGSRYMMARCIAPDHDDANPSCQVWHDGAKCWSCGRLFDIIDVVMLTEGLAFSQAVDELSGNWRMSADRPRAASASLERPDAPPAELPDDVLAQFKPLEPSDVAGLPKLRGLDADMMGLFDLRWWGHKVLFPIVLGGKIVDVHEYCPDPSLASPKMRPRWDGRPKVLYNSGVMNGRPITIVESEKNVWFSSQIGIDAVATGGASVFTREMRELLSRVEKLYVCGDFDRAGQKFNMRVMKEVRRAIPIWWSHLRAQGIKLVRGYDLADFVQENGDAALFWEIVALSETDGMWIDYDLGGDEL